MRRLRALATTFRDAFKELSGNDPLRLAGATAFFTTFALPAILIIILQLLRLLFNGRHLGRHLFAELSGILGKEPTEEILKTSRAFRGIAQNWLIAIGGFLFLLFVATTLFKVIKSSLNQLWKIRKEPGISVGQILMSRLRGVLVILFTGAIFLIDLTAQAMQAFLGKYIQAFIPGIAHYYNSTLNYAISIVTVTAWFALVFHFLPDGRPRWKISLTGAFVTSILFNIGKLVLHWLLVYSSINSIYGTSASMVLILLFVFYTSMIFYYGAAFTYVWAIRVGHPIAPLPHAFRYQLTDAASEEGPAAASSPAV